jgi:hypothetical protein
MTVTAANGHANGHKSNGSPAHLNRAAELDDVS